jgi:hypothetical protein
MQENKMPKQIPKVKQAPFDKQAFLKAAEKIKKIVEKEKSANQNA